MFFFWAVPPPNGELKPIYIIYKKKIYNGLWIGEESANKGATPTTKTPIHKSYLGVSLTSSKTKPNKKRLQPLHTKTLGKPIKEIKAQNPQTGFHPHLHSPPPKLHLAQNPNPRLTKPCTRFGFSIRNSCIFPTLISYSNMGESESVVQEKKATSQTKNSQQKKKGQKARCKEPSSLE